MVVCSSTRYGAQHPIVVHSDRATTARYVVVGHCCESGDLFTCAPGDPEVLQERELRTASIGDLISVEAAGAYCASMSTKNYNSFPEAPEVLLDTEGQLHLIRRRQTLEQIVDNEVAYEG
jgi:diaminopimelate decarboxylase